MQQKTKFGPTFYVLHITWVKKVRGVFKINVILNSNSEISFEAPYLETIGRYKWSIISQKHSDNFPTLNN